MNYRYLLGLGSNQCAEQRLTAMIDALLREFGVLCLSPVCQTTAVGLGGRDYLNAVVSVQSPLPTAVVKAICKQIEARLGRIRPSRSVAADIDILACWDKPRRCYGREVTTEQYLWPMADCVLHQLGLRPDGSPVVPGDTVQLTLASGQCVGLCTLELGDN